MTRVRVVVALCVFFMTAFVAGSAGAQDARTSSVQRAARDWLAIADRGDAQASWNAMAKLFKDSITAQSWAVSLREVRIPLGDPVGRTVLSTQFSTKMPKAPDGDYALVIFRTAFAKKVDVRETVTLSHEADGVWRVVGYMVR
jgi:uncharacterized protein DUF4019